MSWTDALLAGAIVLGAAYLIYRSLWKKPGYCPGCEAHTCDIGRKDQQHTSRAATSKDACRCDGNCRDCACRPHADQAAKKQVNSG